MHQLRNEIAISGLIKMKTEFMGSSKHVHSPYIRIIDKNMHTSTIC